MMADVDLAALLCSRLCHDLVSPVGAINNGLEILQEEHDADMRDAVVDLIQQSTKQTGDKLQFFRLAFGSAGGFGMQIDTRETEAVLRSFLDNNKVTLHWHVLRAGLPKDIVRLILNLALVTGEAMVRGGDLTISFTENAGQGGLTIRGEGPRIIMQDVIAQTILGKTDNSGLDPRLVPAYLAHQIATDLDGHITQDEMADGKIGFSSQVQIRE